MRSRRQLRGSSSSSSPPPERARVISQSVRSSRSRSERKLSQCSLPSPRLPERLVRCCEANQLKGKINQLAKEKAYAVGIVSCETNAHGTSQYCSRCGARGERFSRKGSVSILGRGGKLFRCQACSYEVQADFNAKLFIGGILLPQRERPLVRGRQSRRCAGLCAAR
jgi:hypothetical protein